MAGTVQAHTTVFLTSRLVLLMLVLHSLYPPILLLQLAVHLLNLTLQTCNLLLVLGQQLILAAGASPCVSSRKSIYGILIPTLIVIFHQIALVRYHGVSLRRLGHRPSPMLALGAAR